MLLWKTTFERSDATIDPPCTNAGNQKNNQNLSAVHPIILLPATQQGAGKYRRCL